MIDSRTNQTMNTPNKSNDRDDSTLKKARLCDYCNEKTALLYCRADSAKLCFSCDKEVHATNQLFTKHSRSQLCDACDNSPASIFCESEKSVLCQNCDWEIHSSSSGSSSVHSRRPVEGFVGCPSVSELVAILGLDDLGDKSLFLNEKTDDLYESSDLTLWETPEIVNLNDLIVSSGSGHNYRAMEVPPLPKNRNAACGKHKEEMLRQLHELAKTEPGLNFENADAEPDFGLQFLVAEPNLHSNGNLYGGYEHDIDNNLFPSYEVSGLQWFGENVVAADQDFGPSLRNFVEEKPVISDKAVDNSGVLNQANDGHEEDLQVPIAARTAVLRYEINNQDRDSALSRYKEKKKTRRYDKHIRYESRKVRAESRTRIKGRFAKMDG